MQQFEFHAYRGDDEGVIAESPDITFARLSGDSAARAKAGRMSRRINGPVDLAIAGAADWNDRYLTTASPSEYHSTGYRFERLA
ncbi:MULTISPECIES: hypothetical protein [Rhizobium/Agrobacterium group]|jgi:hypothetical protein|uniref:hypothetical protein n=1 Tax=Rhizobium/Agrobacterium group TaxID=227290 RepID=UPI002446FCC7|nr:hypothetical protein [Agrobacterium sp. GD03638]MCW5679578.1 hypothetical protein [Xanthobacteraceae bacterium]MCW5796293.1 hypothetical protein [Nitrospira sp.]MCW5886499.1 hypothetical protein [Anaerolineales bacterium]MDH2221648.1 hypothetical protein [Agrobacterium sp. GD03638]